MPKIKVKTHLRNGEGVEGHDREIDSTTANLATKLKRKADERAAQDKLESFFEE